MRIAVVVALLLTAVLIVVSFAAADLRPNELGRVMVLEYHKVDYPEERWTRTPENFRRDLETLYARGYRLQSLHDLLDGKITVRAGFTPVVLTFDDSSPGQFRYIEQGGTLVIDPKSAVGVLEAFIQEKPDFGRSATFFVLPGASRPNRLFNQPEHEGRKLRFLVERGYEIGNHTLWHANLGKYPEAVVRKQIADRNELLKDNSKAAALRKKSRLPSGLHSAPDPATSTVRWNRPGSDNDRTCTCNCEVLFSSD